MTHPTLSPMRVRWAHRTPRLRALGFDFAVRTEDPALGRHLGELFGGLVSPGEAVHLYSVVDATPATEGRFQLSYDGELLASTPDADRLLRELVWHVNRQAVSQTADRVLIHAAAAEIRGSALLLPAGMEAGKTTLVAGLVRRGLGYLTDETVAIDPGSLRVDPYPKPLSVDPGSWPVLADLAPHPEAGLEAYHRTQWQVPPQAIRPGALGAAVAPAVVICPSYAAESPTELSPLRRVEALQELLCHSFATGSPRRVAFQTLVRVVRRCRCYRLTVSDLDHACSLVLALLDDLPPASADPA